MTLGTFQLAVLQIIQAHHHATGVFITEILAGRTQRKVDQSQVYITLARLEKHALISGELVEAVGYARPRRVFRLTPRWRRCHQGHPCPARRMIP